VLKQGFVKKGSEPRPWRVLHIRSFNEVSAFGDSLSDKNSWSSEVMGLTRLWSNVGMS
jgi:hypothetical protein